MHGYSYDDNSKFKVHINDKSKLIGSDKVGEGFIKDRV